MKAKSKHEKDPKLNASGSSRTRPRAELFECVVPKPSKERACYTFVVDQPTFKLWVKVMKVRYWIDFGSCEEFNVKWDCATTIMGQLIKG